ncbi:tight adherence protein C [Parelusimicrobium proximum]|uniref:type II secretion system F family protein n=1 Tax=Parelusimicrobium proximum TaxID=3228953 RepID=UPI003D1728F0
MDGGRGVILIVLLVVGAICVFWFLAALLLPAEEKEAISDIDARSIKSTSSFSSLSPNESLWDRFRLFILTTFKLERPLDEMYLLLGSPAKPTPLDILNQKILYAIGLPLAFILLTKSPWCILLMPIGFILPDQMLKSKIQQRQQDMMANFSTTVDLAALIIESGLDYLTAFERIIRIAKEKTILEVELDKMLNEVKLGYSRREALERMAARTGVQEIRSFVGLIVQSDELGTSLVELLRNFSVDLRFRRMNKAEKLAAQASTKMLIPLFIFIFPTVFILMLAPMIKDMMASGGMGF